MKKNCSDYIHDIGLGIGTFLLGFVALIASCQTTNVLTRLTGIEEKQKEVDIAIDNLNKRKIKFAATSAMKNPILQEKASPEQINQAIANTPEIGINPPLVNAWHEKSSAASDAPITYINSSDLKQLSKELAETPNIKDRKKKIENALSVDIQNSAETTR